MRQRRKFNIPILMTTSVLGGGGVSVLPFDEQILALPGLHTYYKLDETSGTTAVNSVVPGTRDATYVGSIPLNQVAFPAGGAAPNFLDLNDDITTYSAEMASAWDFQTGWVLLWFKQDAAGLGKLLFRADSAIRDYDIQAHNDAANGYARMTGPTVGAAYYQWHNDWTFIGGSWTDGGLYREYLQGALIYTQAYTQASPLALTNIFLGRAAGFRGAIAHVAFGAGSVPTDAQIDALYKAAYPDTHKTLMVIGDSWATDNDYWIDTIIADARGTGSSYAWREAKRLGYSGQTSVSIAASLPTDLAQVASRPDVVIHMYTTNDLSASTSESTYKDAVTSNYNAVNSKWPGVPQLKGHAWRGDGAYDAAALTYKGYDDDLIAILPNLDTGVDNADAFKTNVATWSADNLHPNTDAGRVGIAGEWITILSNAGLL